jgi:hypothetical protein
MTPRPRATLRRPASPERRGARAHVARHLNGTAAGAARRPAARPPRRPPGRLNKSHFLHTRLRSIRSVRHRCRAAAAAAPSPAEGEQQSRECERALDRHENGAFHVRAPFRPRAIGSGAAVCPTPRPQTSQSLRPRDPPFLAAVGCATGRGAVPAPSAACRGFESLLTAHKQRMHRFAVFHGGKSPLAILRPRRVRAVSPVRPRECPLPSASSLRTSALRKANAPSRPTRSVIARPDRSSPRAWK